MPRGDHVGGTAIIQANRVTEPSQVFVDIEYFIMRFFLMRKLNM
ncbi:hypothetical protein [Tepidibacillus fermentans]|uniref:Uncharacterized protein n=1 Tax=Tepidibacillus fermentans TaxID=1281767 RepID=A0A4R3KIM9_9BACI|nr:hypothetical protein [Tepidibacillus fermentans]TCS83463.1 hypothetical protein EDD72_1046 [Tepidibacillus fermentans]